MATKRVGIIITSQHLIPHGGIGQFAKGLSELFMKNDCIVDIIVDSDEHQMFFNINGNIILPDTIQSMEEYRDLSGMFGNYLRLETSTNIRNSLMKGLRKYVYDLLVVNSPDALYGVQSLCLVDKIPTVYYTHAENLIDSSLTKGPIHLYCDEVIRSLLRASPIIVGTQTNLNKEMMKENNIEASVLPMPIPELDLLTDSQSIEKDGILFIGRIEDRKNFDDFLKIVKNKNYLIKVMTAKTHIDRVEKLLKENGHTNFIVKGGITGEEKVDFIKSSKIMICPSKRESYCFALNECLPHTHCLVLDKYDWWKMLNCDFLHSGNVETLSTLVDELYNVPISKEQFDWAVSRENNIWNYWHELFLRNSEIKTTSQSAIGKNDNFFLDDFYKTLMRKVAVSDIITTYNSLNKYKVTQGKSYSWLSSSGVEPPKRNDITSMFTFD